MSSFVPFFSSHSDESLLYSSLRASLQHPSCASAEWLKNCNISSCHFSTLSAWDNSAYWENKRHENLCMAFPAILDLKGSYSRIGPTFNLADSENPLDLSTLPNVNAVFQLSPLSCSVSNSIPKEAIDCSSMAMVVLKEFYNYVEQRLRTRLDSSHHGTSTPFHRTDPASHRSVFVVNTNPFFETSSLHHSSSVKDAHRNNSNLVESLLPPRKRHILSMRGSENQFLTTFDFASLVKSRSDYFVSFPNIRDGEGRLIAPDQYGNKLTDGSVVIVNVSFKLMIVMLIASRKLGGNCGRHYQILLNSMQTLPVADILYIS